MKVLMQGRYGLLSATGGDRIQIENTAAELKRLGVEVEIKDNDVTDYSDYDLVHVFQMDWTPETHFFVKEAKKAEMPVVFSPIHHKVSEVKKFDEVCVYDYRRIAKFLFREQHARDTFKNVYRSFLHPSSKLMPTLKSIFKGLKNMHIESLSMADVILVQTELEARDLKDTYNVDFKWEKVPNGVGEHFLNTEHLKNPLHTKDYIFSVGRIEPRKNQLNLIKAVQILRQETGKDLKLVIVGKPTPVNHIEYNLRFTLELKKNNWVTHINSVPYTEIPSYFKFAKVSVSASWFESTGLTLLEALYCGSNAVATSPRAKEILGDFASYCEPDNVESIKTAIAKELSSPRPVIDEIMKKEYTWENAAKKTYEVYQGLLNK